MHKKISSWVSPRLLIGIGLIILIIVARYTGIHRFITLEQFKMHREQIKLFIDAHYVLALLIFVVSYLTFVVLLLPLNLLLTLVGGFLFGVWIGSLCVIIGALIGSSISFLITRYVFYETFKKKYASRFTSFHKEMDTYGIWYLLSMQIMTVVPFFVINTFAALSSISFRDFFIVTAVGIVPGTILYCYVGKELMSIQSASDIFSPSILVICTLVTVVTIGTFIYRTHARKKEVS